MRSTHSWLEFRRVLFRSRPALLLLDEPSVGLDIATRRWLIGHLHDLARDHGIGVLMATHLTDEVTPEDDLIVLDKGRVVAAGRVEEGIARSGAIALDAALTHPTPGTHRAQSGGEDKNPHHT